MIIPYFLIFLSLVLGQVIKIPLLGVSGLTFLDLAVIIFDIYGLIILKFHLKNPPLPFKIFGLFLIVALISSLFSPLNLNFQETLLGLSYLVRLIIYFISAWIIYSLKEVLLKPIPKLFIISSLVLAILGLIQLIFIPNLSFLETYGWDPHYFRTASTLLDPNFLGGFLTLGLLLMLGQKIKPDKWLILSIIITYLAIITTFSRSSALMLITSLAALSILSKSIRLAALTFVMLLGIGLAFLLYQQVVAAPRNIDRQQSAIYRVSSYSQAWQIFLHSPVLGIGYNNYHYALSQYKLAPTQFLQSRGSTSTDSSLLFILATTGILGFSIYLSFLITLFWQALKSSSIHRNIFLAGLLGILIHSLFINGLFYPWILLWLLWFSSLIFADTKN